jgi:hypothetical protein
MTPVTMHVVARKNLMVKNLAVTNAIHTPSRKSNNFNKNHWRAVKLAM